MFTNQGKVFRERSQTIITFLKEMRIAKYSWFNCSVENASFHVFIDIWFFLKLRHIWNNMKKHKVMSAYLFQKTHSIPRSQVSQSHWQNYVSTEIDALQDKSHKSWWWYETWLKFLVEYFVEEKQTLRSVQQVKLKPLSIQWRSRGASWWVNLPTD